MSLADISVDDSEQLSRMVLFDNHVRKEAGNLKPVAFLPYSRVELSVIRQRNLSIEDLWRIGFQVAELRQRPLIGRGDIAAIVAKIAPLNVIPKEGDGLPKNHADIIGWPADKPAQMLLAAELVSG